MTKTVVVDCFLLTLLRRYPSAPFVISVDESRAYLPLLCDNADLKIIEPLSKDSSLICGWKGNCVLAKRRLGGYLRCTDLLRWMRS